MATNVHISSKNLTLDENTRSYIQKKGARLDHYLPDITDVYVDVENNNSIRNSQQRVVAQITIRLKGKFLRAEERNGEARSAFDLAYDKIQNQIEHYKGKHRVGTRRPGQDAIGEILAKETDEPLIQTAELSQIARRKNFPVTAMSDDEALEQMQLLGHNNFFVYLSVETNQMNILYRRHDDTYGIIEPTID
ncbi:MAG TPA: ribosome-associated translation inhibitor RaiA [Anaerolineales bacterium]|nr:ribosome-associated translation inhibitor RaiA [Anaerolineales bacterium]